MVVAAASGGIGERIARMEEKLDAIHDQVVKTNGRTSANEHAISAITVQLAGQQALLSATSRDWSGVDSRVKELELSMGKMKDWRAEMRGGGRGLVQMANTLLTIVALFFAGWAAYSSYIQAIAIRRP
jgi:hypothetical protein